MADNANAEVTADTDIDTNDEMDLENIDTSFDDESDSDESEGDSEEQSDDEAGDESDDESDDGDAESESESEADDSEETQDEPKAELSPEEQRKEHNRENAERRLQEKAQRDALLAQQAEDYITSAEDPTQAALRQLQVDAYNTRVEGNTTKLQSAYERAISDFAILRDDSPEIKAEVDQAIDAFQAMYVPIDDLGNPGQVKADLYTYLKNKADSIEKLTGRGALKQQESKSREKSKTLTRPTRAPKQAKEDPMLAGFDEEASRW